MPSGRVIRVFHQRAIPESADEDAERASCPEDYIPIQLDAIDRRQGLDITDVAARTLRAAGCSPSSTAFYRNIWYATPWEKISRATGEEERRTYHLMGFTPKERQSIFEKVKRPSVRRR